MRAHAWLGLAALTLLGAGVVAPGCSDASGCFGGDDGTCLPPSPCTALEFSCEDRSLEIRVVRALGDRPNGLNALAAAGDVLIGNSGILAVIDAPDAPHHLAPSGGSIIDLVPRNGVDELNQIFQGVGILPDDAARYHRLELIDESPRYVAVIARGRLDGREDVDIVTRYEVRPCEPGVRIRTEVHHGGRDPEAFLLSDAYWWGGREVTPFVPVPGQGFVQPDLDLLKLGEVIFDVPFMAAQGHAAATSAYGALRCDAETGEAFQSTTASALGAERTVVMPGDAIAFERFIAVAPGPGLSGATNACYEAREMLFGEPSVVVSGVVQDEDGRPVGEDERAVSLLFYEPGEPPTPRSEVVPGEGGFFSVRLPTGRGYHIQAHVLGRPLPWVTSFELGDVDQLLAPIVVPPAAVVEVIVVDAAGDPVIADVVLTPADEELAPTFRGSVHGQFDEEHCTPFLGPPHGGSPACNRVLTDTMGVARFAVPTGTFWVYATAGPFSTLDRALVEVEGGPQGGASVSLQVDPLDGLVPAGWLSADFHVHAGASFDSSLPEADRALSFVSTGVEVLAATDHDVVTDYAAALATLGIEDRVRVMPGIETTGQFLFDLRADADFPQVIGHYNFWPLDRNVLEPRNGAPDDERVEPGALFDRMAPFFDGPGIAQLNHPFSDNVFGRDEGYLTAVEYDPRVPVPSEPDDSGSGQLVRRPAGGKRNMDHDAQEVMNGSSHKSFLTYRTGWFAFLNQGILRAGTANSDSHTLAVQVLGYPRNMVRAGTFADFSPEAFNEHVRKGHMIGTNGPLLLVCVDTEDGCAEPGFDPVEPGDELHIELRAAPWIPVEEIRIIVNGRLARVIDEGIGESADPFGAQGLLLYTASVALDELMAGVTGDAWIVVEAGYPLLPAGDVDGDGVIETTDNNGDGAIDDRDQEGREEDEYFIEPAVPRQDDPRFHMHIVAPGTWPTAFTNPILLDLNGDGTWSAPGL